MSAQKLNNWFIFELYINAAVIDFHMLILYNKNRTGACLLMKRGKLEMDIRISESEKNHAKNTAISIMAWLRT